MTTSTSSGHTHPQPLRVLVMSGSMRADSLNTKLARLAKRAAESTGATVDWSTIAEFDCPSYNGDVEAADGPPSGAVALRERLEAADALILASPEYNASMPGIVKNVIDWVSRFRPQPFEGRHILVMSASPSMIGGNRGLWALRVPLENLGARVWPSMFSLSQAHEGFTDDGELARESLRGRFDDTVRSFLDEVEASTHYPCIKRSWVEFPSEPDAPEINPR